MNQPGETLTLEEAGVESIHLSYLDGRLEDGQGNFLTQLSSFARAGGGKGLIADVLLGYLR